MIKAENTNNIQPTLAPRAAVNWVMLIYFCSGLCSLIDEVIWVRLLKLTLGNTVYASSIVVSMFMGGLALGALIMSRYADRIRKPLHLYAFLEVCATVSALSLPFALRYADTAYRWFYLRFRTSPAVLMLIQVLFSAVILLVPTMLMGSTFPLLGRYITTLRDRVGRLVGRLYALNTFGATIGCFLAGFVLIRLFGVMGALYIAAGINLLVALSGAILSRFYEVDSAPAEVILPQRSVNGIKQVRDKKCSLLVLAFFVSGLISIGYELIWMRSIVIPLGGYTYVFSAVLTIYLLGNVLGAWIGSRLSKFLRSPSAAFGISMTCLGFFGIIYIPFLKVIWLGNWNIITGLFEGSFAIPGMLGVVWPLFHSASLFFLPAVTMGIGFPLALQAWSNHNHKVGQTTGFVYGANTIGAVLGGIITGFILIPMVGTQLSITSLGLLGIWFGLIMIQVFTSGSRIIWRTASTVLVVITTVVAIIMPPNLFREIAKATPKSKIISLLEGVTSTACVSEEQDGSLLLTSDGLRIAGDDIHRSAQQTLGHLGPLLNKNTKKALSIGFGCGETTACLAQYDLDLLDCVEISPELVQLARKSFKHINLGDQLDEKVNIKYMDGKNFLYLTDKMYDVIINGANIPSHSGSAPLFTKEHFQKVKEHLYPGGIFITKLHIQNIIESNFDSILGTFLEAFPGTTIWFPTTSPYNFFYLVGSQDKQMYSVKYIDDRLQSQDVQKAMDWLKFRSSFDTLSCYIGDGNDIRRYLKEYRLNSDYYPFVEFNIAPENIIMHEFFTRFINTVRTGSVTEHIDWDGLSTAEQNEWLKRFQRVYDTAIFVLKSHGEYDAWKILTYCAAGLKLMPENSMLLKYENISLSFLYSELNKISPETALATVDSYLQNQPDFGAAWLFRSWALQRMNNIEEALIDARKAVQHAPGNFMAWNNLGAILMRLRQYDEAVSNFNKAISLNPSDAGPHFNLGMVFLRQSHLDEAILQFRQVLQIQPRNADAYRIIGDILSQKGQKEKAIKEYQKALRVDPGNTRAERMLNQLIK